MVLTELAGFLVGAGGFAFGLYQYYQTKENNQRKKRLKQLSEEMDDVRSRLEKLQEGFKSPLASVDLSSQLDMLSKEIVVANYETNQTPQLRIAGVSNKDLVRNERQAVDIFREKVI